MYFDKRERGAESDPARVALRLLSRTSYRCSCFQLAVEAQLLIREISRFGLNPKQADLQPLPHSLPISAQKQTLCPPAVWGDGPQNPRGSAHPVLGVCWQR